MQAETQSDQSNAPNEGRALRIVERSLPWFMSLALHLLMVMTGFLVVWSVTYLRSDAPQTAIDPGEQHEQVVQLIADDFLASPAPLIDPIDVGSPPIEAPPMDVMVAPDMFAAPSPGASQVFMDAGEAAEARFAGTSATGANRIVYVLDASGSMRLRFPIVVNELMRSLDRLREEQQFLVVLFQNDEALVPDFLRARPRLLTPTPEHRGAITRWLDEVVARGTSSPIEALRLATQLKPDTIFLLSNNITGAGQYELSQAALFEELDRLNPVSRSTGRRAIVINAIQFLDEDPLDTMRLIAERHGVGPSSYNFIGKAEAR